MPNQNSSARSGEDWPLVSLNTAEVREVYEVAAGYHEWGYNPNALELGKDPFQACLLGAMGELAACKFYGIVYEPVFHPDEGFDLRINGWRANVKATPYFTDPWLRVMDKLNKNCDVYLLVAVEQTSALVKMVGWIPQVKLQKMPLRKLRKDLPPCRVAAPSDLWPCRRPADAAQDVH